MLKRKRTTLDEITEAISDGYSHARIPDEVLFLVLHKLPIKVLMKFCCVCKLLYKSILNDPRFIEAHFLESQKNPQLVFKFLPKKLVDPAYIQNHLFRKEEYHTNHLFYVGKGKFGNGKTNVLPYIQNLIVPENSSPRRLIGYCNGLVCFTVGSPFLVDNWIYLVTEIFNFRVFSKLEKLRIVSRIQSQGLLDIRFQDCRLGYDVMSKEYKLMCILKHSNGDRCIILTLGSIDTQSWREIELTGGYSFSSRTSLCIDGALFWAKNDDDDEDRHDLVSFDLHEEKFQVIKLPHLDLLDYGNQLEYKRCFCYARVKKPDSHSGAVELYILKDSIKQVWIKETITFDLPRTIRNPPPAASDYSFGGATFSLTKEGITRIRLIEFAGRIYLYWRKLLEHKKSHVIQFYDLNSKKLIEVQGPSGGKCGYDYHVISHVENLVSLKAWAMNEGDGGGVLVGRDRFDGCSIKKIQDMFKQMPPSEGAAVSFYFPLSFSGENNETLVI